MKRVLLAIIVTSFFVSFGNAATIKWDGQAGDGLWSSSTNWVGDVAPATGDDIILDNSNVAGSYTITLPAGNIATTVSSLTITPSNGNNITLILPATNTSTMGFVANGAGDAIVLNNGAILINASGAMGTPLTVTNLNFFRINNGGHYIHRTKAGHTNYLVSRLSTVAGTEKGIFEFDIPQASSTISLSGRNYGTLILSSVAFGAPLTYLGNGTMPLNIFGDLIINGGVTFNTSLSADIIVHGNFTESVSSSFNLQSSTYNNVVRLQGDVSIGGNMTQSNTGFPVLEFNGSVNQNVSVTGSIVNNVTVKINNPAGITLKTPMQLPYILNLQNGKIRTTNTNILTLIDNATVAGGSSNSFIEGPMIKIGDDNFTFPVGKGSIYAPIGFTSTGMATTDAFQAEYFRLNPQNAYGINYQLPINHVSYVEYWKLDKIVGNVNTPAKVTLAVTQYSFAKDLATLYASSYNVNDKQWKTNDLTEKIPGPVVSPYVTGSVTSSPVSQFGIFTIATSEPEAINPLPVTLLSFSAGKIENDKIDIDWTVAGYYSTFVHFEVERSIEQQPFSTITSLNADPGSKYYSTSDTHTQGELVRYRLKIINEDESITYSNIISVAFDLTDQTINIYPNPVVRNATLNIYSTVERDINMSVVDAQGRIITKLRQHLVRGNNQVKVPAERLVSGIYFLSIDNERKTIRFIKQ